MTLQERIRDTKFRWMEHETSAWLTHQGWHFPAEANLNIQYSAHVRTHVGQYWKWRVKVIASGAHYRVHGYIEQQGYKTFDHEGQKAAKEQSKLACEKALRAIARMIFLEESAS